MIKIIRTLNLNRETTAILENALNIGYERVTNEIWSASFSLPLNDPKVEKVELLRYVEIDDIGLFRIIPKETSKSANTVTFQCEHVLSTLLNSTLFKYHQLTNYTTREVLEYLLSLQKNKHWQLGEVAFTRYFHYSWENENLLSAIFSVPQPFDEQFRWTWDTTSYPWTLNLVQAETEPTGRIKEGHNLVDFTVEENPMSVYNRIYPLGAGEGVNQLGIEDVNNGVPYIEDIGEDEEIMETVWVDKRYEDAETLKSAAEALLKKWKKPIVTWTATAADVSSITGSKIDELKEGKVIRMDVDDFPVTDLRIMNESKSDLTGDPGNVQLQIGNVTEDLSTTQTDMERRQQINELYSQGATNILSFNYQDNCDNNIPALIPFYVDDDVVNVNTCELTFRTKAFRAYSRATEGGGAVIDSTSSGGGTTRSTSSGGSSTQTSSSGGGTSRSTNSGGGSSQTSSSGGNHRHTMFQTTGDSGGSGAHIQATTYQGVGITLGPGTPRQTNIETLSASGSHTHSVSVPSHSHDFSTPNHTHSVSIPSHTHDVEIPNHTHEIELPNHTHNVAHEIVELDSTPNNVTIRVDGNDVPHASNSGDRINLADYMSKDNNGKITRGRHEVEILPNGLARIEADLILRVFIQSRLGEVF